MLRDYAFEPQTSGQQDVTQTLDASASDRQARNVGRRTRNPRYSTARLQPSRAPVKSGDLTTQSTLATSPSTIASAHAGQENPLALTPPTALKTDRFISPENPRNVSKHSMDSSNDDIEAEYPPSPKKSPVKGRLRSTRDDVNTTYGTDMSMTNGSLLDHLDQKVQQPLFTPRIARPNQIAEVPDDHMTRQTLFIQPAVHDLRNPTIVAANAATVVGKPRFAHPTAVPTAEEQRCQKLEAELWDACGRDMDRWNRGDFVHSGFSRAKW